MKLKINTELEISEDEKYVCAVFGITKEEAANHVEFYFNHETLTSYSDIIIELINDNRLDVVCCLASAYLMTTDKSVQPLDDGHGLPMECAECPYNNNPTLCKNTGCPDKEI